MKTLFACTWCGKPAPSGVCAGPHPDYDLSVAVARGDVTGVDRIFPQRGAVSHGSVLEGGICDTCGRRCMHSRSTRCHPCATALHREWKRGEEAVMLARLQQGWSREQVAGSLDRTPSVIAARLYRIATRGYHAMAEADACGSKLPVQAVSREVA